MGVMNEWKRGLSQAWESLAEGWRDLRERAAEAVTRFAPAREDSAARLDFGPVLPASWAVLPVDVVDNDDRIVVRLEAPGMNKRDFTVEVHQNTLVVAGEKQLERESSNGNYRTMQCAYGRFERRVALPVKVQSEHARASYRDGVLRVELPKAESVRPRRVAVQGA